ncbi:hypothetical protein ACWD7C_12145 [Streptomyces sp. NPDC005134]
MGTYAPVTIQDGRRLTILLSPSVLLVFLVVRGPQAAEPARADAPGPAP